MVCAHTWPLSVCSGHGTCVSALDPLLPGDEYSPDSYCVCDEYWVGSGDHVSNAGANCITHSVAIRAIAPA